MAETSPTNSKPTTWPKLRRLAIVAGLSLVFLLVLLVILLPTLLSTGLGNRVLLSQINGSIKLLICMHFRP